MAGYDYEAFKKEIHGLFGDGTPDPTSAEYLIRTAASAKGLPEFAARLLSELKSPQAFTPKDQPVTSDDASQIEPFALIYLGESLYAGRHLSPECHIIYQGWDGVVDVQATLVGKLDREDWNTAPEPDRCGSGKWKFLQSLSLTHASGPCQEGEYRIVLTCRFRGSSTQPGSAWKGSVKFKVTGNGSGTLEVNAGEQSLVNLAGVDVTSLLTKFSNVKIVGGGNALINIQSFMTELAKSNTLERGGDASMATIRLDQLDEPWRVQRKNVRGRLDLSPERRLLFYAQNSLTIGRMRPYSSDQTHTDICLWLQPRGVNHHDDYTNAISRQHLQLSIQNGQVLLADPRDKATQTSVPSFIDGLPLDGSKQLGFATNWSTFSTILRPGQAEPKTVELRFRRFRQDESFARQVKSLLMSEFPSAESDNPWLREKAGMDAVLIERARMHDELDGREAYLMVLGAVMIGTNPDCPIRIQQDGIQPDHAILSYWNGHFRIIPFNDAVVRSNGRHIRPGHVGTLALGDSLQLGSISLKLDTATQHGL